MKNLKPLVICLFSVGVISSPAYALANDTSTTTSRAKMERKLDQLESEVASLKRELRGTQQVHRSTVTHKKNYSARPAEMSTASTSGTSSDQVKPRSSYTRSFNNPPSNNKLKYFPIDVDIPGQSFVSTGPYIGIPLEFSGSNLIINSPSVNLDIALLNIRKNISKRLSEYGLEPEVDHSHLLLSGVIKAQAAYRDLGNSANQSDIDLSTMELDGYVLGPSHWISGLFTLSYDNSQFAFLSNSRIVNSRVVVGKAFVTIGDLAVTPWYGSVGQFYVPFGTYNSSMVTAPMTQTLGRTKARAIVLGFQQQAANAFYGSGFIFKGDAYSQQGCGTGGSCRINDGGVNAGFKFKRGDFVGDIGGGWLADIADSLGMQVSGFGNSPASNELLIHQVPAYDLRGMFGYGRVNFIGEFISAATRFNPNNMFMNAHGAKPKALNSELSFTFTAFEKPSSIALGYGRTQDALAMNLPLRRYSMTLNTSWWRDTLQSLEVRQDLKYSSSATAGGQGFSVGSNSQGKRDTVVTAQFDLYF